MRIDLNSAQTRLLDAVDEYMYTLLGAGVGVGKTTIGRVVVPYLTDKNLGYPGLLVSHVLNHTKTVVIPQTIKYLKAAKLFKRHWKQDRVIECIKDTPIQYGSGDRPDTIEGKDVAWAVGDEIRFWKKEAYDFFTARVRIKAAPFNRIVCLSTLEKNWMELEWRNRPRRHVVHATTYENEHNLRENYIQDLKDSLSPQKFRQYVLAEWVAGSSAVYGDEFDAKRHIIDCYYDPHLPVDMGMDPGVNYPAVVFYQHHRHCPQHGVDNCIHVLDELVPDEVQLVGLIPMIRKKATMNGWRLGKIWIDPFGGNQRDKIYGETVVSKLQEEGWSVDYSYEKDITSVLNGIAVVQGRLLNTSNETRLYFDRRMQRPTNTARNLLQAIEAYRWPERKPGKPAKSHPVEDETEHVMDALRYPLVNLFPLIKVRAKTF